MFETLALNPAACRCRGTGTATAAVLFGAGMACATAAQAGEQPLPDALDAAAIPAQRALVAQESEQDQPLAAATRGSMAGWKPVSEDKLDEMRGGFDAGGLQVSFGIERAVYVNGALVVATSINIPDIARITSAQAAMLASALGPAIVSNTNAEVNSAMAGNPVTAGVQLGNTSSGAGTSASATVSAGAAGTAPAVASNGASASSAGAAGLPLTAVTTPTGQVVTNGLLAVVQNGAGNSVAVANAASPMTVVQNTLNNQSIQSLMTIDAGVNTLQAFRSQVANATLNSVLLRAASMR